MCDFISLVLFFPAKPGYNCTSVVRGVASSETQGQIVGSGSQRGESGVNESLQEQRGELLGCYY